MKRIAINNYTETTSKYTRTIFGKMKYMVIVCISHVFLSIRRCLKYLAIRQISAEMQGEKKLKLVIKA